MPITQQGQRRAAVQQFDILAHTATAAKLTRAAGIGNHFKAVDADRVLGFLHFDRNVGAVHHRSQRLGAVRAGAPAIAAEYKIVDDERLTGLVV